MSYGSLGVMIVVKVGGSLAQSQHLSDCLDSIGKNYPGKTVVIVPGGGGFAEQVRLSQQVWQFNDRTAHLMAILAMQQMALLFQGLKPEFVLMGQVAAIRQQCAAATVIWSPDIAELDQAGIPATWDITSDSLAAWLAATLHADALVLVKSAAIDSCWSWQDLAVQGIVDTAFTGFIARAGFPVSIINAKQFIG
ncbi:MAG: uridylate kinase [Methylovulum sp.]|nr:uridylate kinase [Methylovulum sp.]